MCARARRGGTFRRPLDVASLCVAENWFGPREQQHAMMEELPDMADSAAAAAPGGLSHALLVRLGLRQGPWGLTGRAQEPDMHKKENLTCREAWLRARNRCGQIGSVGDVCRYL